MQVWQYALIFGAVLSAACGSRPVGQGESQPLTAAASTAAEQSVRAFVQNVAHDVTQEGPAAWRREFADSPSFFMASEGRLVFPDSASATTGIQDLARTVKQITLQWGNDLRVDALTRDLAAVGVSYHEVRVGIDGARVDESGFFTGTAEYRGGRWQFRNAHWSVIGPPAAVR